jgi:hypothetical protein
VKGHSFSFQSSVKGDSYPGTCVQRTAEIGGFGLSFFMVIPPVVYISLKG